MKRIAAIIATAFAVLAFPATAMASTSSLGSDSGNHGYTVVKPGGPRLVFCPLPRGVHVKQSVEPVQITYANGHAKVVYKKVPGRQISFRCPLPRKLPRPPVQICSTGTVTFDMPPSSGTFTENSGPQLYTGENFAYNGTTYSVASVSGAVFTLSANGSRYENGGVSVVDGSANAGCCPVQSKSISAGN